MISAKFGLCSNLLTDIYQLRDELSSYNIWTHCWTLVFAVIFTKINLILYRRTPVSMSSPAGTVTPIGESIASSFCGSEGGLTPLATSPSGEGGFDGGFLSTTRGPAVIHDHIRCVSRVMTSCMSHHIYFTPRHSVTLALPIHQFTFVSPTFHKVCSCARQNPFFVSSDCGVQ